MSETWLFASEHPSISTINDFGYGCVHSFRDNIRGGGVMIVFKNAYKHSSINLGSYKTIEYVAAKITNNSEAILYICIYRLAKWRVQIR